jgi:hydrogenase maturation protease
MKTLILGLGNPILSDDAAGLEVARRVHSLLGRKEIDLIEAATGGLQTVQLLIGYDQAIIIDVIPDREHTGTVYRLSPQELGDPSYHATHGVGLGQAIQWGRKIGLDLPRTVIIYAIAVNDPWTFSEELTPEMEKALPDIVREIGEEVATLWAEEWDA